MAISVNSSAKNLGIGSRLIGTLFFSVFLLMGLGFEVMIARQTAANLSTYGWTKAEAVITASEISPPRNDEHDPVLHVRYNYTFRGEQHVSNQIQVGSTDLETSEAYRLAENYPRGTSVPCWVNPKEPDESVLQRKSPGTSFIVLFPLIFVAIGAIGIWAMWRTKAKADDGNGFAKPISNRAKNWEGGRFVLAAFFGVFLLIGSGVSYVFFFAPVTKIIAARNWIRVPCEIIASRVRSHSGDNSTTYSVDIVYRYTYHDRPYTSNRYHFMSISSSGYTGKAEIVRRHSPGTQTTCFVNPRAPADAVLERGATPMLWFGLIPMVFVVVGAGGLRYALRIKTSDAAIFTSSTVSSITSGGTVSVPATSGDRDGPQTLKPAASPKMKLFGVTFAALFWNGIVSVFLFNLISQWRHGGGLSWSLALFLTPFVLVGLGLIGGVFYQFMALFNPRPRLTVSQGIALPGDAISVNWELAGRTDRLQRLQIELEGREEATYRRGTDNVTDKEVFARIALLDTTDPIAMRSGSAKLHIPPAAMHSFKSSNNKIVWTLKVHGDIPRWPDIKDDYPYEIAPKPLAK